MNMPNSDDPAALLAFTRTLLGLQFEHEPLLVAGRVPDGWPSDLMPPAPVETVGGMRAGDKVTALFRYPPHDEAPVTQYRTLLEDKGWKPAGALGGGFDNTMMAMLCRESVLATLSGVGGPAGTSMLVSFSPCDDWPCREGARFPDHGTIKVPRLVSPPGVEWHGGGRCGAGDHTTHNTRITTTLAPAELLPLYARQLVDAGWRIGEIQTTPASALQWLEATDQRRRVWRGVLAVYENGPAREVFIYVATGELRPSPGMPAR